jgi:hypothetical protein
LDLKVVDGGLILFPSLFPLPFSETHAFAADSRSSFRGSVATDNCIEAGGNVVLNFAMHNDSFGARLCG